jgi:hypothetical protein
MIVDYDKPLPGVVHTRSTLIFGRVLKPVIASGSPNSAASPEYFVQYPASSWRG